MVLQMSYAQLVVFVLSLMGIGAVAGLPLGVWIGGLARRADQQVELDEVLHEARAVLTEATGQLEQLTAERLEELDADAGRDPRPGTEPATPPAGVDHVVVDNGSATGPFGVGDVATGSDRDGDRM